MDAGFLDAVRGFKFTSRKHRISDDDAVDRINSYYVPVLIVLMSSIVMTKMYLIGDPVQCWIPPEFKPAWEQYAETYCWLKNTYFIPPNGSIPGDKAARQSEELKYYQWVPFVLAIQALLFYLPSVIWKLLNWQSGVQIKSLVDMAVNCIHDDVDKRAEKVAQLAWHFEVSIVKKKSKHTGFFYKVKQVLIRFLLFGKARSAHYLTAVYLTVKLLYIANVVGQFFLLNAFLGTDYDFYGLGVLHDLWYHHDWRHSGHFPRITLCDFNVRTIGNTHPRTLQCVLVVNLLNEKIFIFLWFLLFFVAVVTIVDAISWFAWVAVPGRRFATLRKLLLSCRRRRRPGRRPRVDEGDDDQQERGDERRRGLLLLQPLLAKEADAAASAAAASDSDADGYGYGGGGSSSSTLLNEFLAEHVQLDGAFVLLMVGKNAGEPVLRALVLQLWLNYANLRLPAPPQRKPSAPEKLEERQEVDDSVPEKKAADPTLKED